MIQSGHRFGEVFVFVSIERLRLQSYRNRIQKRIVNSSKHTAKQDEKERKTHKNEHTKNRFNQINNTNITRKSNTVRPHSM